LLHWPTKQVYAAKPQTITKSSIIRGSDGGTQHQATLVTTQGNVGISPMDTYQFAEKHYTVDRINIFGSKLGTISAILN
jgi:hypothetical protein